MRARLPLVPASRYSAIGVELAAGHLRAVQLRRVSRGWVVHERVELTRREPAQPLGAAEAARLAGALRRRRFKGSQLVLSLPHRDTVRGLLEVTHEKGADPLRLAAQDMERTHQLTPGGYELAAWLPPVSGQRRQTAVCVTGCTHAVSQNLLAHFDATGLNVAAIDSRAYALSRVIDSDTPGARHLTAVIDTDTDAAELTLLQAGTVVYQRPLIDAGYGQAVARLVHRGVEADVADHALRLLGLTDRESLHGRKVCEAAMAYAESLVQEVRPALDYASRLFVDLPIKRFALVGASGRVPLLSYELCQQLRLEPAVTQPPALVDHDPDAALAVALGLTLHPEEASWAAA